MKTGLTGRTVEDILYEGQTIYNQKDTLPDMYIQKSSSLGGSKETRTAYVPRYRRRLFLQADEHKY